MNQSPADLLIILIFVFLCLEFAGGEQRVNHLVCLGVLDLPESCQLGKLRKDILLPFTKKRKE